MAATTSNGLGRWTRARVLNFDWNPHESLERLVFSSTLRERLKRSAENFRKGREAYQSLRLPWRTGIFFFGPSGAGKSSAARALARAAGWGCLTIPAHEILDSHLLERALLEAVGVPERVVVLEDVERMIRRMEPEVFFTLLDHAMERSRGVLWVATSRHPELTPKTQLVRPGRFDESVRLELPSSQIRSELVKSALLPWLAGSERPRSPLAVVPPPPPSPDPSAPEVEATPPPPLTQEEQDLADLTARTDGLSFAHFEELRHLCARMSLEGRQAELWGEVDSYISDQLIAGDRFGDQSADAQALEKRVSEVDPRVLLASLDMTDAFKRLMEKVIADAAEESKLKEQDGGGP